MFGFWIREIRISEVPHTPSRSDLTNNVASLFCPFQILQDPGIHSNLITFIALLLANNCLHLHDIITYIIRPIIRTQIFPAIDMSPNSGLAVEFINSLILHLFVRDYEVVADARPDSPIVLPQFVQHCLEAKCRDLNLGFVLMLLKDLVKIRSSASSKTDSLLVHSNSSGNEVGINKVRW